MHDFDDLYVDLICACIRQAVSDAQSDDMLLAAHSQEWLCLMGVSAATISASAQAAEIRAVVLAIPARMPPDGPVFEEGRVTVVLTRGQDVVYSLSIDGTVLESVSCAPQSWRKVQREIVARAAELAAAL